MNAVNVVKPSARRYASYNMRDVIRERLPLCALSVENPILTNMVSLPIREFTRERNPMSAMNVEKPSPQSQYSTSIKELIQERDRMDAAIVRKPSPTCQTLLNIRKCTQEKWVDSVKLEIPLTQSRNSLLMSELLQNRSPMNVMTVEMPSVATKTALTSVFPADWNVIMVLPVVRCVPCGG